MFTTYRSDDVHLQPGASRAYLWPYVEQEFIWPWFYLQIVRCEGSEAFRGIMMINHAEDLKAIIDEQSPLAWLEQVQVVTPPHINGQSRWLMEPLEAIHIIDDQSGSEDVLYVLSNGSSYSIHLKQPPQDYVVVQTLFSAKRDLRS
ncbi:hypothetical protein [Pseudomonas aeruginosa]|uniref:hypothetical protein n=1 Tax=Pseudomonas aeruginosa TaxID=287 RepID=UPI00093C0B75|nr:hypothetical protein [Pseudomonas aeruginosa]MDP5764872.1 hypothetical protein [Pseudomonas aeruginosa]